MINSMTGYASSSVQAESLSLDFELKSVNSKSLDIKIYLPEYLSVLESELRQFILKNISRGSILFKIKINQDTELTNHYILNGLLYTSPSPRDRTRSRMPSSA